MAKGKFKRGHLFFLCGVFLGLRVSTVFSEIRVSSEIFGILV